MLGSYLEEYSYNLIEEKLGFSKSKIEVFRVNVSTTSLYEEISVLFSKKEGKGIFASSAQLLRFKYDNSNSCGVLYELRSGDESDGDAIRIIGEQSVLVNKGWI